MGIHCEINLHKPADGVFTSGSTVAGSIKFAFDKETEFKNITMSLKGSGHLSIKNKQHRKKNRAVHTFRNHEYYVDLKNDLNIDNKGNKMTIGSYETQFSFVLPEKIPSTLKYLRNMPRYVVRCNIGYYIGIKFEKSGLLQFDKKFKKEITVVSGITPRLPTVPTICGEQKTLTQLFSSKKSIVNIKATIKNCVISPGEKIEFDYEVANDTNIDIKSIETKLVEVYRFTSKGGREVIATDYVKNTDSKTGSIKSGETKKESVEIIIHSDINSFDYSTMVARDYIVQITAGLPFPHRDAVLEIPVQIGVVGGRSVKGDSPPSYWEAMVEAAKSDISGEDDDGSDYDSGGKS